MKKIINALIVLFVMLIAGCNGSNSNVGNNTQVVPTNQLQQYIDLLTRTSTGKQLTTTGTQQQSFITPGGITINSIDINFYSGANCGESLVSSNTLNGGGVENPVIPAEGTYTSTNLSNRALCGNYTSSYSKNSGCAGLYSDMQTGKMRSIQFVYNINDGHGGVVEETSECMYNAAAQIGETAGVEGIANWTNATTATACSVGNACGFSQAYSITLTEPIIQPSLIEFSLDGTEGVIDQDNNTITVAMPYGTDLSSDLTATFLTDGASVTIGAIPQTSGITPHNFSTPVTYTVHAANGDTRNYVVTVTTKAVISQASSMSFAGSYAFLSSNVSPDITKCSVSGAQLSNCSNIIIDKSLLPQGVANVSAFESTGGMTLFITGNGNNANPPSIVQCLLPSSGPSSCSQINAAPGLQASRLLLTNGTLAPESSAKITAFAVAGVTGWINNQNIYVTLPYGANLNGLVATFTTTGKSVRVNNVLQVSGVTSNNYINDVPLDYVVTAKDNKTTSTYKVYVRWTYFAGVALNTYASSIKAPLVLSSLESTMINLSVIVGNDGLYTGVNYGTIESFPAVVNATGLSSIAMTTTTFNTVKESYDYVMSNIAESKIYSCSVTAGGNGIPTCKEPAQQPSQPSSVVTRIGNLPYVYIYVSSYHQNVLSMYSVTIANQNIQYVTEIDMSGAFNLPRSLSFSADGNWLYALNDGDNSYVACPMSTINDPATCIKTYFSSL